MVGAPIVSPEAVLEVVLECERVARNTPAPAAAATPAIMNHFFLLPWPVSPPGRLIMETAGPVPLSWITGAIDVLVTRVEGSRLPEI
jgi:hypothetical protein